MIWFLFIISMGIVGRLAGRGTWGQVPEVIHSLPYGIALGWALDAMGVDFITALMWACIGCIISYAGMQSGTWMFLRWKSHDNPNAERKSTLKPVIDWIAGKFGFKLGDEGYAWIAASVKGFIITLPVGGLLGAVLWPLGYEIGSHAKGRVEKYGIDPHAFSEFFSCALGAVGVLVFAWVVGIYYGG